MSSTDRVFSGAGRQLRARDRRLRWYSDPALFARECIDWPEGSELTAYQAAALTSLATRGRIAVRSPHGAGKTTLTALVVLWFATTRDAARDDWKIVTTAGAWRQLEKYLWPEIHLWAKRVRWDELGLKPWRDGREIFDLGLKLQHGQAFAAASDDPALLEGAHAKALLVCLDEAKSIQAGVFDAVEGALSGPGEALAMATSTPGEPSGRFYDICRHRAGLEDWAASHVTLDDAVAAGRVSRQWAEQRALQWGSTSAVFLNRVLGEFASAEEDGVIPLAWVEAAIERWHVWDGLGRPEQPGRRVIGVDVASTGEDRTVLVTRSGPVVERVERHTKADTMETAGRVVAKLSWPMSVAVVDVIGVGTGVVSRLREQKCAVTAFNSSERSTGHDRTGELSFLNRRAEAWWRMRERLDPAFGSDIALPDDDELLGDLTAPKYFFNSAGKIQVESKDDIRKHLARSPDAGDAVVMAFPVFAAVPGRGSQGVTGWTSRTDPTGLTGAVSFDDVAGEDIPGVYRHESLFSAADFEVGLPRDPDAKYRPNTWRSAGL